MYGDETADADRPKLPLWGRLGLAYSTYFRGFWDALRISWLWILIVAPAAAYVSWVQMSWMLEVLRTKPTTPPTMPNILPMQALVLAQTLLWLLAGVSIAVAWHRRIILGEVPRMSGSNLATSNVWRYLGTALLIGIMAFALLLVAYLPVFLFLGLVQWNGVPNAPAQLNSAVTTVWILVLIVAYITAITLVLRLSLALPARAIGDTTLTFRGAWNRTRGNTWRLFWAMFLSSVPPVLAAEIIAVLLIGFPGPDIEGSLKRAEFVSPFLVAYYLLILPIGIGFLSHAYRHFFRQR